MILPVSEVFEYLDKKFSNVNGKKKLYKLVDAFIFIGKLYTFENNQQNKFNLHFTCLYAFSMFKIVISKIF